MGVRSLPWVEKLAQRYVSRKISALHITKMPPLETAKVDSFDSFCDHRNRMAEVIKEQSAIQDALIVDKEQFGVPGRCAVCDKQVAFSVNLQGSFLINGKREPNWRETLICPSCFLNNRHRATLNFLIGNAIAQRSDQFYVTEQATRFYEILSKVFTNLVGSEFLGDKTFLGERNAQGVRNEDVTRLTFDDETLDLVGTFDVLEHVPQYEIALREFYRCLKPGGTLLISVPFIADNSDTLVRARVKENGDVEHLMPPEYHADPLSSEGVLCYQTFGWDILDCLREAGFVDTALHFYWSRDEGYLGDDQCFILAQKPA